MQIGNTCFRYVHFQFLSDGSHLAYPPLNARLGHPLQQIQAFFPADVTEARACEVRDTRIASP